MLGKLPWISAVGLLCAVAVTTWVVRLRASWFGAAGFGLSNLGYFLVVAGLATGHFGVLGLKRRWQVFLAAGVASVASVILVNLHGSLE
jgi:hypothetical protein